VTPKLKRILARVDDVLGRLALGLAICFVVFGFIVTTNRNAQEKRDRHQAVQANVRARFDDCIAGNEVRRLRRQEIRQAALTEPLLYKLLPSLDTPEVRQVVKDNRERQLAAYADKDCKSYALEAVPVDDRDDYTVPNVKPEKPEGKVEGPGATTKTTP
jgi:hypothetical protein